MTAPAAPLEKAVEAARKALAPATYGPADWLRIEARLRSLLAALDADRGEAEAALMEIRAELGVPQPGYPAPVANAANIARRYFARREEKGRTVDNFAFARVLALHVEALAVTAEVEAMKALNQFREMRGDAQAYGEDAFQAKADALFMRANDMETICRG